MATHQKLQLLEATIEVIKASVPFVYNKENRKTVQKFKNENGQFPWPYLESQVSAVAEEFCGMEESYEKVEFSLFVSFLRHFDTKVLLNDKTNWPWIVSD